MRLSEAVGGATVIVYPPVELVKVEARLATLIADPDGGSLASPERLEEGAQRAREVVESLGVSLPEEVTVQRLDLAAELMHGRGRDGLDFLKACQRGLQLPGLSQVPHYAPGDTRLESIIWQTAKGRQSRIRLYCAGSHHGTHAVGERLRLEVQERWTGRQARSPEQVMALDLGALYSKRLVPWLKHDHTVSVSTPLAALSHIYDGVRDGTRPLRLAHTVASKVAALAYADDLLSPHERNRRRRELREAGVTLDLSGEPATDVIDLREPLTALAAAWLGGQDGRAPSAGPGQPRDSRGGEADALVGLSPAVIEAIASRVADLVIERSGMTTQPRAVTDDSGVWNATADDIARRHRVSAAWVRANAEALGGVRIGRGSKPRHRFNTATVDARIAAMRRDSDSGLREPAPKSQSRRRRIEAKTDGPLLPIKGRSPT